MEIVKIKTNQRILYAIRVKKPAWYRPAIYMSLYSGQTWYEEKHILEFCCHYDLEQVQAVFNRRSNPEKIVNVIPRKCKCNSDTK